jgi:hypothetical protein
MSNDKKAAPEGPEEINEADLENIDGAGISKSFAPKSGQQVAPVQVAPVRNITNQVAPVQVAPVRRR